MVFLLVGTWLSLVEHSLGVRGVGSSNLPVPTIHLQFSLLGVGNMLLPAELGVGNMLLPADP